VAFGGVERHRERLRDGRRVPVLEPLAHDLRFGMRALGRSPGLSLVAALTIALGVGATTTVFSAMNAVLLRPLPVPEPDRLGTIQERRIGIRSTAVEGELIAYPRYEEYRDATSDIFASVAAFRLVDAFSLRLPDVTVGVNGALTSGSYFETLGVRPALGRAYTADDAPEVVISHALWMSRFGGDPSVVGRSLGLDGRRVTVVGVAPREFHGVTLVADQLWAPVGLRGLDPESWSLRIVPFARLRPGVERTRASAAVDALARRLVHGENVTVSGARLASVAAVPDLARGPTSAFLGMLLGMAVLVLLIAAANIAAIMVARGVARRREMAVRLALGAGRARMVRHLLAESLLIFGAGGVAGVGLAYLGAAWLQGLELPPTLPPLLLGFEPDGRVLGFAILVTALVGLLAGLLPALRSSRPNLVPALKAGAQDGGGRERGRDLFVGAQIALATTLLVVAALFVRSVQQGRQADVGFDAEGVIATTIDLGAPHDYDAERGRAFNRELAERVRALPGVEAAGLSQLVLLGGSQSGGGVRPEEAPDQASTYAAYSAVTPQYFGTMGIEIVEGRGFTAADDDGAPPVAVVNRTLADRLWPGQSPIGRRFTGLTQEPLEVIGVTPPGAYVWVTEESRGFSFLPYSQRYKPRMNLHVRAPGAEAETIRRVADIVRALDPDLAIGTPVLVTGVVGTGLFMHRFAAQLVGAFGVVGLILAALGIYGVLAYQVARRTRELGVRRALGATSARVVGTVLGRGATLAAAGCLVGAGAGAGMAVAVRSFLFGVHPLDPVTFSTVPLGLFAVALLASWLPARRAASVRPAAALRTE
jgi:predicted permease